jgi:hypothetical protein
VALFAAHAELAVMHIVRPVAGHAIAAYGGRVFAFGRLLFMAAFAGHLAVRTVQQVLCSLVVVEIPQSPRSGVVAAVATHAKLQLMLVFLLVTGKTVTRGIPETRCLVATLASGRNVPTRQREPGQTMIELGDTP